MGREATTERPSPDLSRRRSRVTQLASPGLPSVTHRYSSGPIAAHRSALSDPTPPLLGHLQDDSPPQPCSSESNSHPYRRRANHAADSGLHPSRLHHFCPEFHGTIRRIPPVISGFRAYLGLLCRLVCFVVSVCFLVHCEYVGRGLNVAHNLECSIPGPGPVPGPGPK